MIKYFNYGQWPCPRPDVIVVPTGDKYIAYPFADYTEDYVYCAFGRFSLSEVWVAPERATHLLLGPDSSVAWVSGGKRTILTETGWKIWRPTASEKALLRKITDIN